MRFKIFLYLLFLAMLFPRVVRSQDIITTSASLKYDLSSQDLKIVSLNEQTQTLASLLPIAKVVSFNDLLPEINLTLLTWKADSLSKYELPIYDNWIYIYARKYNVNPMLLRKMAFCESSFNPKAQNGIYLGLYQFSPSTWSSNRRVMQLNTDPDIRTNPEEMIRTTAFKINYDGNVNAWPRCGASSLQAVGEIEFVDK